MEISNRNYLLLVFFHLLLGGIIYLVPSLSIVFSISFFFIFIFIIIKNKDKNNEALLFSSYIVTSEVFFRMTNGVPNNEFGKYSVIIFLLIGVFYSGFSKRASIFWLYLLFLIPGIVIGVYSLSINTDIRKAIAFNISGPVCLAFAAIYTFDRKVNFLFTEKLISTMIYPILATVVYLFLYTPSNRNVFFGTDSNFQTSGGFGPNQVSTILGLGMFLIFVKLVLFSKNKFVILLNLCLFLFFTYRGIITFSRGGVVTGVIMILAIIFSIFLISNGIGKIKVYLILFISLVIGVLIFTYSSIQTGGLIEKRYSGQDALGRNKASKFSGREKLVETEIDMFLDNPIFGGGVGVNKQYREDATGISAASHNEISRTLAEHGLFGIFNILILICTPLILYFYNKSNLFLLSFFIFWLLTINHAAMRIAAPAFIYALSLLKISFVDETESTLHR